MNMFKIFPIEKYWWGNEEADFKFRNFFIKAALLEYIRDNPDVLSNYALRGNERPDVMSYKLYGTSDLHWTIYLVNDIVDPRDWALPMGAFERFLKDKYDDVDAHFYSTRNGEFADLKTNQFMVTQNPFGTVDSNPDPSLTDPQTYSNITYRDYERMKNDSKLVVKAIKKEYMPAFLSDFENKIKGLEGR